MCSRAEGLVFFISMYILRTHNECSIPSAICTFCKSHFQSLLIRIAEESAEQTEREKDFDPGCLARAAVAVGSKEGHALLTSARLFPVQRAVVPL